MERMAGNRFERAIPAYELKSFSGMSAVDAERMIKSQMIREIDATCPECARCEELVFDNLHDMRSDVIRFLATCGRAKGKAAIMCPDGAFVNVAAGTVTAPTPPTYGAARIQGRVADMMIVDELAGDPLMSEAHEIMMKKWMESLRNKKSKDCPVTTDGDSW